MSDTSEKSPPQLKMVSWYHPGQLAKTAVDVIISLIFGRHADYRLVEAFGTPNTDLQDYSQTPPDQEFWIDYVADLGDGWNSTYAIAYHLAQPQLGVQDPEGNHHLTQRGSILIFGGDAVYPVASRAEYKNRLVTPYTTALCYSTEPFPDLYVIPGNHDWYDSLASYSRLFCAKRWFGGWRTQQARSYFALKLPHHWWLIGIDMQLNSDIDDMQVNFLKKVAKDLQPNDNIILCCAEPEWFFAKLYGEKDPEYNENNFSFLENHLFNKKISIFLTGDLHHYRRHENHEGTQKIIAGGGGAFLHPTHGQDVSSLPGGFTLKKEFPDADTSRKLCRRNFAFLFLNPFFGILTGLFYLLTAWSAKTDLSSFGFSDWKIAFASVINQALKTPMGLFWIVATILGFIAFTDTHSRIYRYTAGLIHGLTHVFAAFLLGWGAAHLSEYLGFSYDTTPQLLLSALFIFIGGWIIGSCVMGIYLFISLNIFGRHSNEAFSSLAIQDFKNFLRIKIDAKGEVSIYPIGIHRVPRKWKVKNSHTNGPGMIPDDSKASDPHLIEKPIKIG